MSVISLKGEDFTGLTLDKYDKGLVMILFKAEWCGYCNQFKKRYDELSVTLKGSVIVTKVDIDEESELLSNINGFAYGYKVMGFPTIVLYKDGKYVKTYSGDREIKDLIKFVNTVKK